MAAKDRRLGTESERLGFSLKRKQDDTRFQLFPVFSHFCLFHNLPCATLLPHRSIYRRLPVVPFH